MPTSIECEWLCILFSLSIWKASQSIHTSKQSHTQREIVDGICVGFAYTQKEDLQEKKNNDNEKNMK